ncbi:hypothetical protein GCM10009555_061360 [Acrocarpospora macrocephala]|uniref:Uncharacterized protein n=1 Tax=Acrocarpospora macrocephala TaxID=150177 RepID=A0A5M3WN43_9ACTN|nr:hypothetical protein Amac_031750 [Acrocarpospora macrocephala]
MHVYFGNKIHMMYDGETGLLTHILRARFPTPPTWRLQWPDARLAITSIIAVPEALDPADQTALQAMIDTKRRIVWNLPDEELLGLEILASGEEVNADARSFLEWARWCDEYAAPEATWRLRARPPEH